MGIHLTIRKNNVFFSRCKEQKCKKLNSNFQNEDRNGQITQLNRKNVDNKVAFHIRFSYYYLECKFDATLKFHKSINLYGQSTRKYYLKRTLFLVSQYSLSF